MAHILFPNSRKLTQNGAQSMLQGIFNERTSYEDIHKSILQHFNNDDFDALRSSAKSINRCLLRPHHQQGPAGTPFRLRYQADLIDRCDANQLVMPPALAPIGTCPNSPRCNVINRRCNSSRFVATNGFNWHPPGGIPLVCKGCRDNSHWNRNPLAIPAWFGQDGHTAWRTTLARAKISVCRRCDREQRAMAGDDGLDGCTCYRDLYERRWYCHSCDRSEAFNVSREAGRLQSNVKSLGNKLTQTIPQIPLGSVNPPRPQMQIRAVNPPRGAREKPLCPCGREKAQSHPPPSGPHGAAPQLRFGTIPVPFLGTQHLEAMYPLDPQGIRYSAPAKIQHTMQCVLCCEFVVPPKRRSERLKRQRIARQVTQARGTATTGTQPGQNQSTRRRSKRLRNRK